VFGYDARAIGLDPVRAYYATVVLGIVGLGGAIAAAFAQNWLLMGILLAVFAVYCVVAPRLLKRVPPEAIERQSRSVEQTMAAMGSAEAAGWNPRHGHDREAKEPG
jgi:hypothetical protein